MSDLGACPVCGQLLAAVFNSWEPSDGIHRHEGVHADDGERVERGLPELVCSWAEPMAVAIVELAGQLAAHIRAGELSYTDITRDCRPDIVRLVREELSR